MKLAAILALAAMFASCQLIEKETDTGTGLAGYDPDAPALQRAACEKSGGNYTKAGSSGGLVCFETTRDAGKTCTAGTQCQGMCLARSGTCSPLTPLFGCHEILTDRGAKATVCTD